MRTIETTFFKSWAPVVVALLGYAVVWGESNAANKEQDKKLDGLPALVIAANNNGTKNVEQDHRLKRLEDKSEIIAAELAEARRLLILINERTDELLRKQRNQP